MLTKAKESCTSTLIECESKENLYAKQNEILENIYAQLNTYSKTEGVTIETATHKLIEFIKDID